MASESCPPFRMFLSQVYLRRQFWGPEGKKIFCRQEPKWMQKSPRALDSFVAPGPEGLRIIGRAPATRAPDSPLGVLWSTEHGWLFLKHRLGVFGEACKELVLSHMRLCLYVYMTKTQEYEKKINVYRILFESVHKPNLGIASLAVISGLVENSIVDHLKP